MLSFTGWILYFFATVAQADRLDAFVNPEHIRISSIEAVAACTGPGGAYQTTVLSTDTATLFRQTFTYKPDVVAYRVSRADSCQAGGKPLHAVEGFVGISHDFVRLALQPDFLMATNKTRDVQGDTLVMEGKTSLGFTLVYRAHKKTRQPLRHDLFIPGNDGPMHIRWTYSAWARQGKLRLPKKVTIAQGDKIFIFDYTDIRINHPHFALPSCEAL